MSRKVKDALVAWGKWIKCHKIKYILKIIAIFAFAVAAYCAKVEISRLRNNYRDKTIYSSFLGVSPDTTASAMKEALKKHGFSFSRNLDSPVFGKDYDFCNYYVWDGYYAGKPTSVHISETHEIERYYPKKYEWYVKWLYDVFDRPLPADTLRDRFVYELHIGVNDCDREYFETLINVFREKYRLDRTAEESRVTFDGADYNCEIWSITSYNMRNNLHIQLYYVKDINVTLIRYYVNMNAEFKKKKKADTGLTIKDI